MAGFLTFLQGTAAMLADGNYGTFFGSQGTGASGVAWNGLNKLRFRMVSTNVTGAAGATITATNLIPAKALVIGVNLVVTSTFSNTSLTSMNIGDGSDADLWGATIGLTAGTKTSSADYTATGASFKLYTSANNVVLTGVGANFAANGAATIEVIYLDCGYSL